MNMKKGYWIVAILIVVVVLYLAVLSQTPTILSATISPEVTVKGQSQEVTVTLTVKPRSFIPPTLKAVMAEQGYKGNPSSQSDWIKFYSVFQLNPKTLGNLTQQSKDSQGNDVYKGTFAINSNTAQTVQIQPTNMFGMNLLPDTTPPLARLAITARPATLPPDPGDAGKATLVGTDSDNNGLRDDVQREIFFLAPQSEKLRLALGQEAIADQQLASQTNLTNMQADALLNKEADGGYCVYAVHPTTIQSLGINLGLENLTLNTILNTVARKELKDSNYLKAGIHSVTSEVKPEKCSFNPADYQD